MLHEFIISGDAPTCGQCNSDLARGLCLRCDTGQTCRCQACGKSFTLRAGEEPLAFCDRCFSLAISATVSRNRDYTLMMGDANAHR